ncbi:MAG: MGMT family protein, partial [Flavobacteriales bacterium]
FEDVWAVVRLVPRGRVTTYGAIAKYLGTAKSARMVGWAMNASHLIGDIPAHRVVNREGVLTGKHHFAHENLMEQLLNAEGILTDKNRILKFNQHFWDPNTEISLS